MSAAEGRRGVLASTSSSSASAAIWPKSPAAIPNPAIVCAIASWPRRLLQRDPVPGTPVYLLDGRTDLDRHPGLAGQVNREAKVLAGKREREGLVVVAVLQDRQHIAFQEVAGRGAGQQAAAQGGQVDAGPGADHEHLGGGGQLREPEQVDHELDAVAGAVAADVQDALRIAHRGQQRERVQEGLPVAADEDLQRARPRPAGHAGALRCGAGSMVMATSRPAAWRGDAAHPAPPASRPAAAAPRTSWTTRS